MGFFGLGSKSKDEDASNAVQRSVNSVALAKKRMNKSKSQRDAEDAQWEAEDAELAQAEDAPMEAPSASVSTYNPTANPSKPAVKSAMKKKSKFDAPPTAGAKQTFAGQTSREHLRAKRSRPPTVALYRCREQTMFSRNLGRIDSGARPIAVALSRLSLNHNLVGDNVTLRCTMLQASQQHCTRRASALIQNDHDCQTARCSNVSTLRESWFGCTTVRKLLHSVRD